MMSSVLQLEKQELHK